ncbi:MAG: SusC/RagA family TonB-linked outer membrane protein [Bacteroidota bacterium]
MLKGPSATSLYGSRGSSGVVLITTKSGKGKGKMQVGINSSFSVEKAYVLLQRQDKFGQGYDNAHFDSGENWSWGPAFDGVVRPWTSPIDADGDGALESLMRPFSAAPNQLDEFFNYGNTLTNSVNLSGSKEGFTYYASYSNTNQNGILDNTSYKRNTVLLKASANLSEKLKSNFKVSYARVDQNTNNEGSRPFEGINPWASAVQSPVNIPLSELRDYNNPFYDINGYYGSYTTNPYFLLNEYGNQADIDNFLGNASVTYSVIEGLDLIGRFGTNVVNTIVDQWIPKYEPGQQLVWGDDFSLGPRGGRDSKVGQYSNYAKQNITLDMSALANYTKQLNEDFSLNISAGYNWYQTYMQSLRGATAGGLVVDGVYNLSNSVATSIASAAHSKYRIFGALGNARIGFRDAVFLELSARNDWSSTLPADNNSFFYSAVGTSIVLSDLLPIENDVLSFLKLRSSYGSTGKDAGLYLLNSYYVGNPNFGSNFGDYQLYFPLGGQPGFQTGDQIGNASLSPELTTTLEVGADFGLFDERINLSYTYYSSVHSNQIVQISLPRSTGFTSTVSNIGEMTNKGHEVTLSIKPIAGLVDGLSWEIFGTYAKNINEVVKITDDIDELALDINSFATSTGPPVALVAKEGYPFGTFRGQIEAVTPDGKPIVGDDGIPVYSDEEYYLGSYIPKYIASFGSNGNYRGIGFNILFDMKVGGSFVSQTKANGDFNGTNIGTIKFNREAYIIPNSVVDNGDGTYSENTTEITEQDLYTNYKAPASEQLINAGFLKLREVGVSYTVPANILASTPFTNARIGLFGKNLKFWLPEDNKFADPEISGPSLTGNVQGIETTQTPPSKSFGVNLSLTF